MRKKKVIRMMHYPTNQIFKKHEAKMYIDPNTGGIVFQVLAAAFVAVSGFLMVFSGKIRQAIAKMRRSARKDKSDEQE